MSKYFCFTQNNPKYKPEDNLKDLFTYLVYQREKGKETGTIHFQGYVCMKKLYRYEAMHKLLPGCNVEGRKKSHKEAKEYCKKEDTRVEGPWEFGDDKDIPKGQGTRTDLKKFHDCIKGNELSVVREVYPTEYYKYYNSATKVSKELLKEKEFAKFKEKYNALKVTLRDWQLKIIKRLLKQDERKVLWIVDEKGGAGKTFLSSYLQANYSCYYSRGGKTPDITYGYNYENLIVFDFTRDYQEYVNYGCIEMFKDGKIVSSKYESTVKITTGKKVLVLSNFEPIQSKMSIDRWDIHKFKDGKLEKITIKPLILE